MRGLRNTAPPITALLLVIALATNWKTQRRNLLLIATAVFVLGGVVAGVFLEPTFSDMIAVGYSDAIDPALQRAGLPSRQWCPRLTRLG